MGNKLIILFLLFSLTAFADDYPDRITMLDGRTGYFYISQLYLKHEKQMVELLFFFESDFLDAKTKLNQIGCEIKKIINAWCFLDDYAIYVLPDEIKEIRVRDLGTYTLYTHEDLMKYCYGK